MEKKYEGRIGGVRPDPVSSFRPGKDMPEALRGEMEWMGGNNNRRTDPKSTSRAKY